MFIKKILIDLDGVLNEYGKEKFNERFVSRGIITKLLKKLKNSEFIGDNIYSHLIL